MRDGHSRDYTPALTSSRGKSTTSGDANSASKAVASAWYNARLMRMNFDPFKTREG
jgi:hypothetical protein